jgi:hypothetical protein
MCDRIVDPYGPEWTPRCRYGSRAQPSQNASLPIQIRQQRTGLRRRCIDEDLSRWSGFPERHMVGIVAAPIAEPATQMVSNSVTGIPSFDS